MKDEEMKIDKIEGSHTLGGYRRCTCSSTVRYTIVNRSCQSVSAKGKVWLRKSPMDLCEYESEDHEDGSGPGVNTTLLSDTL